MDGQPGAFADTCENLNEVHRILKPGGIFAGACLTQSLTERSVNRTQIVLQEKSFDYVCSQEAYPSFEGAKFEKISVRLTFIILSLGK